MNNQQQLPEIAENSENEVDAELQNSTTLSGTSASSSDEESSSLQGDICINTYQQRKTYAQGMMDLALFSASANQLRFMIGQHAVTDVTFFYTVTISIVISILLQIAVALGLMWNSIYDFRKFDQRKPANQANNWTIIGIVFITITNVFISAFGIPYYEKPSLEEMLHLFLSPVGNSTSGFRN